MIHRRAQVLVRVAAFLLFAPLAGFTQCGPDEVPIGRGDGSMTTDGGSSGGPCVADADCAAGQTCAYAVAQACAATGVCLHNPATDPGPHIDLAAVACGCDGTVVTFAGDYPRGYAPKPVTGTTSGDPTHLCSGVVADGGAPTACTTDAQCGAEQTCGFAISLACAATGRCLPYGGVHCDSIRLVCACGGGTAGIPCDYPAGYAPQPIAGTDPSSCGSSVPPTGCTRDAQCAIGETCGFPVADACMATGRCIYNPAADPTVAHCESIREACGCDGTTVDVACDYPSAYAPRPVQSDPTACAHH